MRKILIVCICLISLTAISCDNDNKIYKQMSQFMSVKIDYNHSKMLTSYRDSLYLSDSDADSADYQIIVFSDSTACTPCLIKGLASWNYYADTVQKYNTQIVIILSIDSKDTDEIHSMISQSGIEIPVMIDTCHAFISDNPHIIRFPLFRIFVINNKGEVLMMGNPFQNTKTWKLFERVLKEDIRKKEN